MCNWFTEGLKDNASLEKAVLTGVLRVSKESIFSGFNNPGCYTLLGKKFGDKFGLLEEEVSVLLKEHDIFHQLEEVRKWYNGYKIGDYSIYNPWSILEYIDNRGELRPYWVNTSDNGLIKKLLIQGGPLFKQDLEKLLEGKSITKSVNEEIVFKNLENQIDSIFGLFLFSGYLTLDAEPASGGRKLQCSLRIPNQEIMYLYEEIFENWLTETLPGNNLPLLLQNLVEGQIEPFTEMLQTLIINTMSYYDIPSDEPEKVYHAFVLGLLVSLEASYEVKSNRESGFGRYDVCLIPKDPSGLGIIMEFKKIKAQDDLQLAAEEALTQIAKQAYAGELSNRGIKRILMMGLAFQGKQVFVKERYS